MCVHMCVYYAVIFNTSKNTKQLLSTTEDQSRSGGEESQKCKL